MIPIGLTVRMTLSLLQGIPVPDHPNFTCARFTPGALATKGAGHYFNLSSG